MALFTSISQDNLVTHEALAKRYSIGPKTDGGQYEVHRYTTKRFSFVGMTETAARTAANNLSSVSIGGITLARYYYVWKKGSNGKMEHDSTLMLKDEIAAVHESGPMWRVDVNVNEDDIAYVDEGNIGNNPSTWPFPNTGNYWEAAQ